MIIISICMGNFATLPWHFCDFSLAFLLPELVPLLPEVAILLPKWPFCYLRVRRLWSFCYLQEEPCGFENPLFLFAIIDSRQPEDNR